MMKRSLPLEKKANKSSFADLYPPAKRISPSEISSSYDLLAQNLFAEERESKQSLLDYFNQNKSSEQTIDFLGYKGNEFSKRDFSSHQDYLQQFHDSPFCILNLPLDSKDPIEKWNSQELKDTLSGTKLSKETQDLILFISENLENCERTNQNQVLSFINHHDWYEKNALEDTISEIELGFDDVTHKYILALRKIFKDYSVDFICHSIKNKEFHDLFDKTFLQIDKQQSYWATDDLRSELQRPAEYALRAVIHYFKLAPRFDLVQDQRPYLTMLLREKSDQKSLIESIALLLEQGYQDIVEAAVSSKEQILDQQISSNYYQESSSLETTEDSIQFFVALIDEIVQAFEVEEQPEENLSSDISPKTKFFSSARALPSQKDSKKQLSPLLKPTPQVIDRGSAFNLSELNPKPMRFVPSAKDLESFPKESPRDVSRKEFCFSTSRKMKKS